VTATPPQITACIDGDGTRVTGRMCPMDPRFADGFTSAFQHRGVAVTFVGTAGGGTGGGDGGLPRDF
jgi:hypothetical protein